MTEHLAGQTLHSTVARLTPEESTASKAEKEGKTIWVRKYTQRRGNLTVD